MMFRANGLEFVFCAGVVKQSLPFDESQGQPVLLDIHNSYLAVLTSKALVRVFKLAGTEVKPHAGPGECAGTGPCLYYR
jgi:hypothetical protein